MISSYMIGDTALSWQRQAANTDYCDAVIFISPSLSSPLPLPPTYFICCHYFNNFNSDVVIAYNYISMTVQCTLSFNLYAFYFYSPSPSSSPTLLFSPPPHYLSSPFLLPSFLSFLLPLPLSLFLLPSFFPSFFLPPSLSLSLIPSLPLDITTSHISYGIHCPIEGYRENSLYHVSTLKLIH